MTIRDRLATSLGQRDEQPNIALAEEIAAKGDQTHVKELFVLISDKDKNIQSDAIKVIYEVTERNAALVQGHVNELLDLLASKNNRLVWGAMTALDQLCSSIPKEISNGLAKIIAAADKGSVIVKDHAVGILIKLTADKAMAAQAIPLLLDQMRTCPTNQLPMYAEQALPMAKPFAEELKKLLTSRLDEIEKESKRKRVEKVIKKL